MRPAKFVVMLTNRNRFVTTCFNFSTVSGRPLTTKEESRVLLPVFCALHAKCDHVIATVVERLAVIEHDDGAIQPGGELSIVV
jgi:hypothetical protein